MKLSHTITCAFAVAFACFCLPSVAAGEKASGQAEDPELKEELAFIEALVNDGLSGLATPVIDAAKKKWPSAAPALRDYEVEGLLMQGKFDEFKKEVDALKGKQGRETSYWKLRLKLADAYYFYAKDKMPECREIYRDFFQKNAKPSADLLDFYVESGFRWAQICTREKDYNSAVGVYSNLLATISEKDNRWSNVALSAVELFLRLADDIPADTKDKAAKGRRTEYLKLTSGWVDKLLWKRNQPLVFGKAIAMMAHIEMLKGKPDEAQTLVNNYMQDLNEIHSALMEADPDGSEGYVRDSPMPECRYLLAKGKWGKVQEEAKKPKANEDLIKDLLFGVRPKNSKKRDGLGAYNHALNVYVKYSDSVWAADAADLAEEIEKFVKKRYDKDIRPKNISSELAEKARNMRFKNAYELFHGQEYEKAIAAYEAILAHAPESKDTVVAHGVIAESYVNLRQNAKEGSPDRAKYEKSAKEAEDYVATQYKDKDKKLIDAAGDQTLRLAAVEKDLGQRARAEELYAAFFTNYPAHASAAQTAYRLANEAFREEDWVKASGFFKIFVTTATNSPNIASAYNILATCSEKLGNVSEQEKWLREYVKVEKKVGMRTLVLLKLADMQQKRGFAAFEAADKATDKAAAEAICKDAYRGVAGAIRDFRAIAVTMTNELKSAGKSLDEKVRDEYILRSEQAFFLEAICWQRLTWPTNKISVFRAQAVRALEGYLAVYPAGSFAPQALVRISIIHTAEKNMKKAQEALARLQDKFPESDEAKNALPRLAKSLIDMGEKSDGARVYKKMLEAEKGKYTPGQFYQAGNALLAAELWQEADAAYAKSAELAASLTNAAASVYLAQALLGQAAAARGRNEYADARQKLEEFIEKHKKSAFVTNAYDMLVNVSLESIEKGRAEGDDAFSTAFGALKKLRPYREAAVKQFDDRVLSAVEKRYEGDKGIKDELWAAHAEKRRLQNELTDLDFRRLKVFRAKLKAEQDRPDEAAKTRTSFIGVLTSFLAAQDPFTYRDGDERKTFVKRTDKFVNFDAPAVSGNTKFVTKEEFANLDGKKAREDLLSPEQCERLEFCYGELLPLMVEQGLGKEDIEPNFDRYMELFGANGAYKKGEHYGDVENIRSKVKGN